jgi:antitoxin PrlF
VGYVIEGNEVRLVNAATLEHDDPVLNEFLAFVARDLAEHPDRISIFPASLLERARALTAGVSVDHEAPITGAIAL